MHASQLVSTTNLARPLRHKSATFKKRIAIHKRCQASREVSADKAWCVANVMACPSLDCLSHMQKVGFTESQADALFDLGKSDLKDDSEERRLMLLLIVAGFTCETATAIMNVKGVMMDKKIEVRFWDESG